MRYTRIAAPLFLAILVLAACTTKQEGTLEGMVSPPTSGVRIAVSQLDRQVAVAEAGAQDGAFRIAIPAGTYDVSVIAPSSQLPVRFTGIVIKAKQTTVLPPVAIAPRTGSASIRGVIRASGEPAIVTLLESGIERASVTTTAGGQYEFEGLPAGNYRVQIQTPGYAPDAAAAVVQDGQQAVIDVRMLYRTNLDGVDWNTGLLRARGIGVPPAQAPTPTIRREMARRAAIIDAERNLARGIESIQLGPSEKLITFLGEQAFTRQMQGYLQGYRMAAERDLDGGRVEVELELPLTGPGGLTSYIRQP